MRRSAIRFLAVVVLSLLGAPLAMHIVVHDLHHDHHEGSAQSYGPNPAHGDHEHPVISSNAPRVFALVNGLTPSVDVSTTTRALLRHSPGERNFIAFGALRLDNDVGPQSLLSTFLI